MKRAIIGLQVGMLLAFPVLAVADSNGQTNAAVVDAAEKRTEIREQLLKYTPLGCEAGEVVKFIHARLPEIRDSEIVIAAHPAEGPSAEASAKRGVRVIKLDLSDPRMNPFLANFSAPMPDESGMNISLFPFGVPVQNTPPLYIQWAFDSQDRLVEIFLDRSLQGQ